MKARLGSFASVRITKKDYGSLFGPIAVSMSMSNVFQEPAICPYCSRSASASLQLAMGNTIIALACRRASDPRELIECTFAHNDMP